MQNSHRHSKLSIRRRQFRLYLTISSQCQLQLRRVELGGSCLPVEAQDDRLMHLLVPALDKGHSI
uniref:Uncharacterized protein n=1 Tax=Triticum urartu TaxID=4572 RepID=A0A8R7Q419_TRIUA